MVVLVTLWCSPAVAGDLEKDFLGVPWSASFSDLDGFSIIYKKADIFFGIRPNETRTINNVDVGHVIYGFYNSRFFGAYVNIQSLDAFSGLRQELEKRYGTPRVTIGTHQKIYNWKHGPVKIKLKMNEQTGDMKIGFYYTPLADTINEKKQEIRGKVRLLPIEKDKKPSALPLLEF